jgi:hypothetical protein
MPLVPFALVISLVALRVFSWPGLASDHTPPTYASYIAGITCVRKATTLAYFVEIRILLSFCTVWLETAIFTF